MNGVASGDFLKQDLPRRSHGFGVLASSRQNRHTPEDSESKKKWTASSRDAKLYRASILLDQHLDFRLLLPWLDWLVFTTVRSFLCTYSNSTLMKIQCTVNIVCGSLYSSTICCRWSWLLSVGGHSALFKSKFWVTAPPCVLVALEA